MKDGIGVLMFKLVSLRGRRCFGHGPELVERHPEPSQGTSSLLLLAMIPLILFCLVAYAQTPPDTVPQSWAISSPDARLLMTVELNSLPSPYPGGIRLYYKVERSGQAILDYSPLGLTLAGAEGDFVTGLTFVSRQDNIVSETYPVRAGKKAVYANNANETILTFTNRAGQSMQLVIRAYNDGVAYRYYLPGSGTVNISSESSGFRLPDQSQVWAQSYVASYEGPYLQRNLTDLNSGNWAFPLLVKLSNDNWALLTEAALYDTYAGSLLEGSGNNDRILLVSFVPDQTSAVAATLPLSTPWRVANIGPRPGHIVESTIVENLNPASEIGDTSWVKPGRAAWSWWSDPGSPRSLATQQQYVDFAVEMGWEYVLVDDGWDASWITQLVSYARARNVELILWYFWGSFTQWTPNGWVVSEPNARSQFERLRQWGISSIKVDFMESESQERMRFYEIMGRLSAEYRVTVNYHGTSKPTGESRRWPQILTREGVQGAEHKTPGALHNTTLPFTRNAVGPMDYTPVTFSNPGDTTYAHQLALSVIFTSYLQHFADSAAVYRASVGNDLLKIIPVSWDDTKFVSGYPGDYAVIARKKGNDWYVGAINTQPRTIQIPLTFLDNAAYEANIYRDGSTNTAIIKEFQNVTAQSTLSLLLNLNGGAAIWLKRTILMGDINIDAQVNVLDVQACVNHILGIQDLGNRVDVNSDGSVNVLDVQAIVNIILGV